MGTSLLITGDIAESRAHLDRGLTLYDPAEHRPLATRFGQDVGVAIQCYRSWALWLDGYPETALATASQALEQAREIGQAVTLIYVLWHVSLPYIWCGNYRTAKTILDELDALADQKGALLEGSWDSDDFKRLLTGLERKAHGSGTHDHQGLPYTNQQDQR